MPFNTPLPAENTDPWYTPLVVNFIGGLRTFVNALEQVVNGKADASALTAGLATKINTSEKAAANGVATLGADGKLLDAQLPAIAITEYLGAVANQAAMLTKVGQSGDWVLREDLGTVWIITGATPSQLSSWTQLGYPTAPVSSVNGQTGVVVISPSSIGAATAGDLDNVFTLATEAQTDATQALADAAAAASTAASANTNANGRVPTARTVAGYPLTANVPKAAVGATGLLEAQIVENGGSTAGIPAGTIIFEVGP